MKKNRSGSESGVVLIAVLGGILVLTIIAFALSGSVRVSSEELQGRKERLQAYYLARGATFSAAWLLSQMSGSKDSVLHPGQQSIDWTLANGKVHVDLFDEGGKIDLNQVQEPLLEQLLIALGYDLEAARPLATSIVDWRDPSSLARWERAQATGNLLEYDPSHAKQARYNAVEELLTVPGMKPEIFYGHYARRADGKVQRLPGLIDCVTVDSGSHSININYAAYPVLVAVTGMNTATADFIVSARAQKPFTSVGEVTSQFVGSLTSEMISNLSTQNTGIFTLLVTGQTNTGIVARVRSVVKMQGLQSQPFQIVRWKDSHVQ
jgi:general secretion pathway protein K